MTGWSEVSGVISFTDNSRTRMALSGLLIDHHQPLQVSGVVWMDHQWGNFLTPGGGGWDWFSIQLNNDTEIMLYLIPKKV